MTAPRQAPAGQIGASRRRAPAASDGEEHYTSAVVGRGQADAVLGALGRMQLRLDVLAREQRESLDQVLAALERLSARFDEYDDEAAADPDADPGAESDGPRSEL
jgi:hypothetical protein